MMGVAANTIAIVIGTLLGLLLKNFVTASIGKHIEEAMGFCIIALGVKMAMKYEHVLILISCVGIGGLIGTTLRIEHRVNEFARYIESKFSDLKGGQFAKGFSSASILFCTGAMAVVGSIQSGVTGNHEVLYAKALLDGILSVTFAAIYGAGVAFSALSIFIYQGSIALLASQIERLSSPAIIAEISGVGGVLLMMIGINLTGIKKVPVGDYLPAVLLVIVVSMLSLT